MQMGTFTKETGTKTKLKEGASMIIEMVPNSSETGKKIVNMVMELKLGQMKRSMKEIMNMVRNMVSVPLNGQMDHLISASSTITIFMEKEFTHGLTTGGMRANGAPTRCMARAPSHGLMAESMSANILTTKRKAMVSSCGQMAGATVVSGLTVNNMEKELMLPVLVMKNTVNGKTVKEQDG
jgi:urease gamma subunit